MLHFYLPKKIPKKCLMFNKCPYDKECLRYGNAWSPEICLALHRLEEKGIVKIEGEVSDHETETESRTET
jgi:hypothetical protein